jgi:hypothetical protein
MYYDFSFYKKYLKRIKVKVKVKLSLYLTKCHAIKNYSVLV